MGIAQLASRGARYHWRRNLGVTLGAALTATVLVGALAVGDSVRATLRAQALARIGGADAALVAGDRFPRASLADGIASELGAVVAPVILLEGVASAGGGALRANHVAVHGIDERFLTLASSGADFALPGAGQVLLNQRLAERLDAEPGDEVLVRLEKPSPMPRDAAFADNEELSLALRVRVTGVVPDDAFGRFGLAATQVPPFNAFLSREALAAELGLGQRANFFLAGRSAGAGGVALSTDALDAALGAAFQLDDAELYWRAVPAPASEDGSDRDLGGELDELVSRRVFLDPALREALEGSGLPVVGVLTYFVNAIRREGEGTDGVQVPYSMVSAVGPLAGSVDAPPSAPLPPALERDEIAPGAWLAQRLGLTLGETLSLDYWVVGERLALEERTARLRVAERVPREGWAADPTLMPELPGISGAEHCRDWEPGVEIDLERIGPEDEDYWGTHGGTPKAFVAPSAARELFGNRFGSLTAVRVPRAARAQVDALLARALLPASLGLWFRDVRGPALAASSSATDFGGLFLGLSIFLIVAALMLAALLFVFGVEQRVHELGCLRAVGFRRRDVSRMLLAEGAWLALFGVALGTGLGLLYTRAVLAGLSGVWADAVASARIDYAAAPSTIALGAGLAWLACLLALAWAMRRILRRPVVRLLAGEAHAEPVPGAGRPWVTLLLALACAALGIGLAVTTDPGAGPAAAGTFFGSGALLLGAGLFAMRHRLAHGAGAGAEGARGLASLAELARRNTQRRPSRSLATVALLASGAFLVLAVGAMRRGAVEDPWDREAGTGGFALVGESSLPVLVDLDGARGREAFALSDEVLADVRVLPLRVEDGDDASCLNLSSPQRPRLAGVAPRELAARGAFRFAQVMRPTRADAWLLLEGSEDDGAIPAIGDQASVQWSLKKKPGDVIEYVDERGEPFLVRIVATVAPSILQGTLLISEEAFSARFPGNAGYRMFLVDAPAERVEAASHELTRGLEDVGLELEPSAVRLAQFDAVQNTYLSIFQALGGLGLLLGTLGLLLVVLRNALEREGELATLRAIGYPKESVRRLLILEHGRLVAAGLVVALVAAAVALVPTALGGGRGPRLGLAAAILVGVASSSILWVLLASSIATRRAPLNALRNEC